MNCYRIKDWEKHFENNRTKELKRLGWVPMPNRMDGDGYTELLEHENGAAHFGAWCALVEVASRCDPRGTLLREGAKPHDFASLARISRLPAHIFAEVLPRLIKIGWVEVISVETNEVIEIPQEGAVLVPQDAAALRARTGENGMEWNGKNGMESIEASPPADENAETKPRKKPTGPHAELIAHWCQVWEKKYHKAFPFAVAAGRNAKHIKTLLDTFGFEEAAKIVDRYLACTDGFLHGHPLGMLLTQLPKFVVEPVSEDGLDPEDARMLAEMDAK